MPGLTCLVVGYGRIGRQVARLAAAFDMRIVVVDPRVPEDAVAGDGFERADSLQTGLRDADFVVLACALTLATRHLIDTTSLAQMKPGACAENALAGLDGRLDPSVVVNAEVLRGSCQGENSGCRQRPTTA